MPPVFLRPLKKLFFAGRPCWPRTCQPSPAGSKNADQAVLKLKLPTGWHVQFWLDQGPARTIFSSAPAIKS
jgi:hypothetical protein